MLKLLAVLLTLYSCQGLRHLPTEAAFVSPLEKRIILSANSQAAAREAQSIIHIFCPPSRMQVTDMGQGIIELHFSFLISFPHRFKQMLYQLAQVPGITILKEQ